MATVVSNPKGSGRVGRLVARIVVGLLVAVVAFAVVVIGWFYWRSHACLPQLDGEIRVAGLAAPVEVLRDARGVPHLRAQSLHDLAFAQGYVTAQDRLWQMDLNRRLAMGELAEVFGRRLLRPDIENRTLGFPEVARQAVQDLSPEERQAFSGYAAGVNAFIASHQDRLPIEFVLLRYRPRPWTMADSFGVALNMWKALNTSWQEDLMRERLRAKVPPALYADLLPDHAALDRPVAEALPAPPKSRQHTALPPWPDLRQLDPTLAALLEPSQNPLAGLGSNDWVVSGAHTASGKPLLANDPHLGHSVPSIWYMVGLKSPELNVTGVTFPGLPLVIIGHNPRIAWGVTNTGPDVQDFYVETFNPQNPNQYLHNGQWENAEVREETIKVRREPDYPLTVKVTRHGPIFSHEGNRNLALCWTGLQPHALRDPFLDIDRAQNWTEFTQALRNFTSPEQNFVYADVDGDIGYYAAAWVPIRRTGDGSIPVPGATDEYDWTGYIPFEDLPHSYNPSSGIIATANSRVVPDGYPYFITHAWAEPYRTARIFQLLEAKNGLTVDDMLRIQMDIVSLEDEWLARKLVAAAAAVPPASPDAQFAIEQLRAWDGAARVDSAATLVCEVTRPELLERIVKPQLGAETADYHWPMSSIFLENVIDQNLTRWLPPGDADFNHTLMASLEAGVARIPEVVGSHDHAAWQWGKTIPLTFHHRLSLGLPILGRLFDVGPFPQQGMGTTVKATTPFSGPSMRMVADLGDLERSVQNITLGESGQLSSPYYRDQFDAWYKGYSFPMLFSDQAVREGAVHKLALNPQ